MQIGFLTNCLRQRTLPEIIAWAGTNGFTALEIACWPPNLANTSDPSLDVENFDQAQADALLALAKQHNITFTCLTYCPNTIDHDPAQRAANVKHLYQVMDAAKRLGVNTISTFVGRDITKTQTDNYADMEQVFAPLLDYAAERNIRVAIENCPMPGWQFEGLAGNVAYAPLIWDEMFKRLPHANFGLNLDPSHLVWLGVDYLAAVAQYRDRIFHTHAKDTSTDASKRSYDSIMNSGWNTWWQYRLPGKGEINWQQWAATLRANGYNGVLSIEHEDPDYEHTEELVKEGLLLGQKNLTEAIG